MKAVALFFSAKIDNFMGESEFLIKILLKLYKFSGGGDFFGGDFFRSGLFFLLLALIYLNVLDFYAKKVLSGRK